MNATAKIEAEPLALLRQPFPQHQISKLPKPYKKDSAKGNCKECGGYHGLPAVHLDYVGHAALTDRLLDTDPHWNWEPMGLNPDGTPALDRNGGLWIKLTVCGVTRPGYGCADGKTGGNAIKELIGDALRNAAMRFGAALDLWHKGELHADDDGDDQGQSQTGAVSPDVPDYDAEAPQGAPKRTNWGGRYPNKTSLHKALVIHEAEIQRIGETGTFDDLEGHMTSPEYQDFIATALEHAPHYLEGGDPAPPEFRGMYAAESKARDLIAIRGNVALEQEPA
jgi:hypothetical protein